MSFVRSSTSIPGNTSVTEKRTIITSSSTSGGSSSLDGSNAVDDDNSIYYRSSITPRQSALLRTSSTSPLRTSSTKSYEYSSAFLPASSNVTVTGVHSFKNNREREKKDMQALNERFANYIEKVRFLEAQNKKLAGELDQLKSHWGKETGAIKQMYETELEEARRLIDETNKEKARLQLRVGQLEEQLDDFQRQLDDAKKWRSQDRETINKLNQQVSELEGEIRMLRRSNDSLDTERGRDKATIARLQEELEKLRVDLSNETIGRLDAENKYQTLLEEMEFMKSVHEQELKELSALAYRDTTAENREFWKNELSQAIRDIQQEYDIKVDQIRGEMETFYNLKVQEFRTGATKQNMEVTHAREETKKLHKQLGDTRGRLADLEARNAQLEKQYQDILRELEQKEQEHILEINSLKEENNKLRSEMEGMLVELQTLMDAKLSLELEIAAYRKLLEGEETRIPLRSSTWKSYSTTPTSTLLDRSRKSEPVRTSCMSASTGFSSKSSPFLRSSTTPASAITATTVQAPASYRVDKDDDVGNGDREESTSGCADLVDSSTNQSTRVGRSGDESGGKSLGIVSGVKVEDKGDGEGKGTGVSKQGASAIDIESSGSGGFREIKDDIDNDDDDDGKMAIGGKECEASGVNETMVAGFVTKVEACPVQSSESIEIVDGTEDIDDDIEVEEEEEEEIHVEHFHQTRSPLVTVDIREDGGEGIAMDMTANESRLNEEKFEGVESGKSKINLIATEKETIPNKLQRELDDGDMLSEVRKDAVISTTTVAIEEVPRKSHSGDSGQREGDKGKEKKRESIKSDLESDTTESEETFSVDHLAKKQEENSEQCVEKIAIDSMVKTTQADVHIPQENHSEPHDQRKPDHDISEHSKTTENVTVSEETNKTVKDREEFDKAEHSNVEEKVTAEVVDETFSATLQSTQLSEATPESHANLEHSEILTDRDTRSRKDESNSGKEGTDQSVSLQDNSTYLASDNDDSVFVSRNVDVGVDEKHEQVGHEKEEKRILSVFETGDSQINQDDDLKIETTTEQLTNIDQLGKGSESDKSPQHSLPTRSESLEKSESLGKCESLGKSESLEKSESFGKSKSIEVDKLSESKMAEKVDQKLESAKIKEQNESVQFGLPVEKKRDLDCETLITSETDVKPERNERDADHFTNASAADSQYQKEIVKEMLSSNIEHKVEEPANQTNVDIHLEAGKESGRLELGSTYVPNEPERDVTSIEGEIVDTDQYYERSVRASESMRVNNVSKDFFTVRDSDADPTMQMDEVEAVTKAEISTVEEEVPKGDSTVESIEVKVPTVDSTVDEKKSKIDSTVDEKVSTIDSTVDEKVSTIYSTVDEKMSAVDSTVDEKVSEIYSTVDETLSATDSTVNEKESTIDSTVDEKVSTIDSNVDEKVSTIDSTVDEKVSTIDSTVDEKVSTIASTVDEKISTIDSTLDGKVSAIDSTVDEKESALDSTVDVKVPTVDFTLNEKIPYIDSEMDENDLTVDSAVNEKVPSVDSTVNEKVPTVDSTVNEKVLTVDSAVNEKVLTVDSTVNEKVPTVDSTVNEKAPTVDSTVNEKAPTVGSTVNEKVSSVDSTVNEKFPSEDSTVNEKVLSVDFTVNEKVPSVDSTVNEIVPTEESWEDRKVPSREYTFVENVQTRDSTLGVNVSTVDFSEDGKVPTRDCTIDERVSISDSAVDEKFSTKDFTSEKNVPITDSTVDEKVPTKDSTVDEKVPTKDSTVDEKVPTKDSTVDEKVPTKDSTVDEKVPTKDSIVDEKVPTKDSAIGEKVPTKDSAIGEKVPTKDSAIGEKVPTKDSAIGEKVPTKDSAIGEKVPTKDSAIGEKVPTKDSAIGEKVPTKDSTVDEKVPTKDSTVDEKVPTKDSTVDEKVPTKDSTVDENFPTKDSTVDEKVTTKDSIIDEKVQTKDSAIGEKVQTKDSAIGEKVPTKDSTVDEKVPTKDSTVDEKVPTKDSTIDENVPTKDSTIDEKVPAKDSIVDENVPTKDSTVDEKVPTKDSAIDEKVPTKDSTVDENVPTKDSPFDEKVPFKDSTVEEKVSAKESTIDEKVPTKDSTVVEKVTTKVSIDEKVPPKDSTVVEKVSTKVSIDENVPTKDSTVVEEVPTKVSINEKVPTKDSTVDEKVPTKGSHVAEKFPTKYSTEDEMYPSPIIDGVGISIDVQDVSGDLELETSPTKISPYELRTEVDEEEFLLEVGAKEDLMDESSPDVSMADPSKVEINAAKGFGDDTDDDGVNEEDMADSENLQRESTKMDERTSLIQADTNAPGTSKSVTISNVSFERTVYSSEIKPAEALGSAVSKSEGTSSDSITIGGSENESHSALTTASTEEKPPDISVQFSPHFFESQVRGSDQVERNLIVNDADKSVLTTISSDIDVTEMTTITMSSATDSSPVSTVSRNVIIEKKSGDESSTSKVTTTSTTRESFGNKNTVEIVESPYTLEKTETQSFDESFFDTASANGKGHIGSLLSEVTVSAANGNSKDFERHEELKVTEPADDWKESNRNTSETSRSVLSSSKQSMETTEKQHGLSTYSVDDSKITEHKDETRSISQYKQSTIVKSTVLEEVRQESSTGHSFTKEEDLLPATKVTNTTVTQTSEVVTKDTIRHDSSLPKGQSDPSKNVETNSFSTLHVVEDETNLSGITEDSTPVLEGRPGCVLDIVRESEQNIAESRGFADNIPETFNGSRSTNVSWEMEQSNRVVSRIEKTYDMSDEAGNTMIQEEKSTTIVSRSEIQTPPGEEENDDNVVVNGQKPSSSFNASVTK